MLKFNSDMTVKLLHQLELCTLPAEVQTALSRAHVILTMQARRQ